MLCCYMVLGGSGGVLSCMLLYRVVRWCYVVFCRVVISYCMVVVLSCYVVIWCGVLLLSQL